MDQYTKQILQGAAASLDVARNDARVLFDLATQAGANFDSANAAFVELNERLKSTAEVLKEAANNGR